jgi:hypothetical protein
LFSTEVMLGILRVCYLPLHPAREGSKWILARLHFPQLSFECRDLIQKFLKG